MSYLLRKSYALYCLVFAIRLVGLMGALQVVVGVSTVPAWLYIPFVALEVVHYLASQIYLWLKVSRR